MKQEALLHPAVILAGGMGSRLAPITDTLPKPLVPVAGVPVITGITSLLKKQGITPVAVTVCALPESFDSYKDPNLPLTMVKGKLPLGSGGSVKAIAHLLEDTFLVISGDTVTDFDLASVMERHKKEGRKATILLKRTGTPGEFGIVSLSGGKIRGFLEKPTWRDTFSDLISTGIYILDKSLLERIPAGVKYDFGRDFFPSLLEEGVPVHGEVMEGMWFDIGTPETYYRCNMTLSRGETVMGEECVIHPEARVKESVLHRGVTVEKGAVVENSILCAGVVVGEDCIVSEGCIIGENTVLEKGTVLPRGTKLGGGMRVDNHRREGRFAFGRVTGRLFDEEGISGERAVIDGVFCTRLGRALVPPEKAFTVGILHSPTSAAELYAQMLACGVQESGGRVYRLGKGFPGVAPFAVKSYGLDLAVSVEVRESLGRVILRFCDKDGLPLSGEDQRALESRLKNGSFASCVTPLPMETPTGEDMVLCRYCKYLQERTGSLTGVRFSVSRRDDGGEFLGSNAKELGAEVFYGEEEGVDSYTVSPDGRRACLITAGGKSMSYWHMVAICASEDENSVVYLPRRAPKAVEEYLQNMGKEVAFYNDSRSPARQHGGDCDYVNDGVLLCLLVASACSHAAGGAQKKTADELLAGLPAFSVMKKELPSPPDTECADRRAEVIASLCKESGYPARIYRKTGCITLFPRSAGGYTLIAEATGWEAAEELCKTAEELLSE